MAGRLDVPARKPLGLAALGLALVGHVFFVLCFYFAALTLQGPDDVPSLVGHFMIVPIGMAIQAGIPLPGGIGGGEYVFGFLYQLIDYPEANGVLMSLVYRSVTWMLGLIGYLVVPGDAPFAQRVPVTSDTDSEPAAWRFDSSVANAGVPALAG